MRRSKPQGSIAFPVRIPEPGEGKRGEAGYLAYRDDPAHREIVQRYVTPIAAQRAAVQYEF